VEGPSIYVSARICEEAAAPGLHNVRQVAKILASFPSL
jgi:hypothetical protein